MGSPGCGPNGCGSVVCGSPAGPRRAERGSRAPVPQSSTTQVPSAATTSTQEVLPPNRVVAGPGAGTEPLVPQKCTRMARSSNPALIEAFYHAAWFLSIRKRTAHSQGYGADSPRDRTRCSSWYSLSLRHKLVRPMARASAAREWFHPKRSRVWRMWTLSASAKVSA
jgi:hypothetical protein